MAKPLSLPEIRLRPEYLRLTNQRRHFVEAYLLNGFNPLRAVLAAYPKTAGAKNASVMAHELLGQRDTKAVVDLFLGVDPETRLQELKQEVLENLLKLIKRQTRRGQPTPELAEAMKFYTTLSGLESAPPIPSGSCRVQTSDGQVWDVPTEHMQKATERDPGLIVVAEQSAEAVENS
jgi:hypothetical protein